MKRKITKSKQKKRINKPIRVLKYPDIHTRIHDK